jgi:hypothetical protein
MKETKSAPIAVTAAAIRWVGFKNVMISAASNGSSGTNASALAIQLTTKKLRPSRERAGFYTEARLPQSPNRAHLPRAKFTTRARALQLTFN